jgi:VWFA-related protein
MFDAHRRLFLFVALVFTATAYAQRSTQATNGRIYLDVVVSPKSGPPVRGLQRQDFVVFDNNVPQTITSFQAVDRKQAAIQVILLIDAVNVGHQGIQYERQQIDRFLRAEGGHLAYPTALTVLQDTGSQIQDRFSSDGKILSTSLDRYTVALRDIPRSAGFYGAAERFQMSIKGLQELVLREVPQPGRKVILWISPGWALFSSPGALEQLGTKQQQQIFDQIVSLSTQLLRGRITLYSIDPLGTSTRPVSAPSSGRNLLKGSARLARPSGVTWR